MKSRLANERDFLVDESVNEPHTHHLSPNRPAAFGAFDVAGDLLFERVQRGELLLVTEFFDKIDFQLLVVKVAGEIDQVGFDSNLVRGASEGGTLTDVQDGTVTSDR